MNSNEPVAATACRPCAKAGASQRYDHREDLTVRRALYGPDHEAYRETVQEFLAREVVPYQTDWDRNHQIDRNVFASAAKAGVYALEVDERYGGAGEHDYRYRMVVCEEIAKVNALSFGLTVSLQDDLVLHYLLDLTTEEQKQRWLPAFAAGELIGALAMTEPGTGSDLRGIRTTARRDGGGSSTARRRLSPAASWPTWSWSPHAPTQRPVLAASACSSSSATHLGSGADVSSRKSDFPRRTPPNCSSTTRCCPPRTCSEKKAADCST